MDDMIASKLKMMTKRILTGLLIFFTSAITAQELTLRAGLRITQSQKIKKEIYQLEAPADTSLALILIEGNNLVIDFNNAELKGSKGKMPDAFFGVALLIRNARNVTIRNLKANGYKVALLARNVEQLTLENCDFSYNYRQHLNSTQEKEDISDWMSYHHNEKDEWLRYGAAMYLRNCDKAEISHCRVTGGQNGLMMTECDSVMVFNNDFSFNSGIGIGMYRSSYGMIYYNRLMFNVRGYSHGVYNRGQDSAGILVFEQCGNNIFYKNNVTHGGDGFFLWAGQYTMDTGEGGCNDNLLFGNDFSYAPTNGIEVTFSRNQIIKNILRECDHGIWGGYSFGTTIRNNRIEDNRIGVAIEHGQQNAIYMNSFRKNGEGIKLWARKTQPADWVYAQKRDTRSHKVDITNNFFKENGRALNLRYTDSITLAENFIDGRETDALLRDSTLTNWSTVYRNDTMARPFIEETQYNWPQAIVREVPLFPVTEDRYAGRKNILITEWGPYDFRSPIIWNTNPADTSGLMQFDILGPAGKWKIRKYYGVEGVSVVNGEVPAKLTARKVRGKGTDILIELDYIGEEVLTPFGETVKAGKAYRFQFRRFFQPIHWEVDWYAYDSLTNPVRFPDRLGQLGQQPPVKHEISDKLDYAWWGGIRAGEKQFPQFITLANGQVFVPEADYELSVTWDDAVRVHLDGKMILDEWEPSRYSFDESPNRKIKLHLSGNHNFRVEHVELNGFATLAVKLRKLD
jgi:parallel beta-helix repeat protein